MDTEWSTETSLISLSRHSRLNRLKCNTIYVLLITTYLYIATGRIRQKPPSKKKFLYIAVMSADKFVQNRVKAAADTWASSIQTWNKQASVDVEIYAQSNVSIGHPIVQMPGISGNWINRTLHLFCN